jgi:hypothetical protein
MFSFLIDQYKYNTPPGFVSLGSFVGIFYEGIIIIGFCLVLIDLFRIYRISKLTLTRDIFLTFLFLSFGVFFSWIAKWWLWHHRTTDYTYNYFWQLIYTFKFSIACAIIGMYYLKMFFDTLYSEENSRPQKNILLTGRKAIEITIIMISQVPVVILQTPEIGFLSDTIAFLILLLDMLFLVPRSVESFKNAKNQSFGKKYWYIGLMAILTFSFTIFFILDRLTMLLGIKLSFNELGYSIFYFAGWASCLFALIAAVYGFIKR